MSFGALVVIRTHVRGTALDVRRGLTLADGATLAVVVPDDNEVTKWREVWPFERAWNYQGSEPVGRGESVAHTFVIADVGDALGTMGVMPGALQAKDGHLRFAAGGAAEYLRINRVPPVPINRPQVYEVGCTGRMLVSTYFKVVR
jgi:hypothetical protein